MKQVWIEINIYIHSSALIQILYFVFNHLLCSCIFIFDFLFLPRFILYFLFSKCIALRTAATCFMAYFTAALQPCGSSPDIKRAELQLAAASAANKATSTLRRFIKVSSRIPTLASAFNAFNSLKCYERRRTHIEQNVSMVKVYREWLVYTDFELCFDSCGYREHIK